MKEITLNGLPLQLLAQRALYIPRHALLVISDWHLGKISHLRKEGLFVPAADPQHDFEELSKLIARYDPHKIVFLGDLFHSQYNEDWRHFDAYLKNFPQIDFILTEGNHDILAPEIWAQSGIQVMPAYTLPEGIVLSHQPLKRLDPQQYNIVGHIHPGCLLQGKGRQRFRLPCFHLQGQILTMPAFGRWTGLYIMPRRADVRCYAIVHDAVLLLP